MTAITHLITPARAVALLASVAVLTACSEPPADANGRFEATEVTISAETSGRMLSLTVTDGDPVAANAVIGGIDTIAVSLSQQELRARTAALTARLDEARSHGRALAGQAAIAEREVGRLTRLAAGGAATAQQLDRVRTEHATLLQQVAANEALQQSVRAESGVFEAQQAQLDDRLGRATVRSPISGVVLTRYVEPGELVQPGTPLLKVAALDDRLGRATVRSPISGVVLTRYVEPGELVQPGTPLLKVAALDTLVLRAYLSEAQLHQLRIGQSVSVQVDDADGSLRMLQGQVTWIASQAEFTPTPIQTREERIAQVYAVTVRVPNGDGRLRIGMPGELMLGTAAGTPE